VRGRVTAESKQSAASSSANARLVAAARAQPSASAASTSSSSSLLPQSVLRATEASLHASYMQHIRSLQKSNAVLSKRIESLQRLQSDHMKMKALKQVQRVAEEKDHLIEHLSKWMMEEGGMSAEELAAKKKEVIDSLAMNHQTNYGSMRQELDESKRECRRMKEEMKRMNRRIKEMESAAANTAEAKTVSEVDATETQPQQESPADESSASSSPSAPNGRSHPAPDSHSIAPADRHATASPRPLPSSGSIIHSLSHSHSQSEADLHRLSHSLHQHKDLLARISDENRTLRGYLTQWEASEAARLNLEQTCRELQKERKHILKQREEWYQEVRNLRTKLVKVSEAKTEVDHKLSQLQTKVDRMASHKNEQVARLQKENEKLKRDVSESMDQIAWFQDRLPKVAREAASKEKDTDKDEEDAYDDDSEDRNRSNAAAAAADGAPLNISLGEQIDYWKKRCESWKRKYDESQSELHSVRKERETTADECQVLQTALSRMAKDLSECTKSLAKLQEEHEITTEKMREKIGRLRTQRNDLAERVRQLLNEEMDRGMQPSSSTSASHQSMKPISKGGASMMAPPQGVHRPPSTIPSASFASDFSTWTASTSSSLHRPRDGAHPNQSTSTYDPTPVSSPLDDEDDYDELAGAFSVRGVGGGDRSVSGSRSSQTGSSGSGSGSIPSTARSTAEMLNRSRQYRRPPQDHRAYDDDEEEEEEQAEKAVEADNVEADDANVDDINVADDLGYESDEWVDPSGTWSRYQTDDGTYYYFNRHTQESVWHDPLLDGTGATPSDQQQYQHGTDGYGYDSHVSAFESDGNGTSVTHASSNAPDGAASSSPSLSRQGSGSLRRFQHVPGPGADKDPPPPSSYASKRPASSIDPIEPPQLSSSSSHATPQPTSNTVSASDSATTTSTTATATAASSSDQDLDLTPPSSARFDVHTDDADTDRDKDIKPAQTSSSTSSTSTAAAAASSSKMESRQAQTESTATTSGVTTTSASASAAPAPVASTDHTSADIDASMEDFPVVEGLDDDVDDDEYF